MMSCKTMPVKIRDYKVVDFRALKDAEIIEIMKAYNEQVTEMKFYIDDLRKQIIISDGYRIKVIDLR